MALTFPRDTFTEAFLGGAWRDFTGYIRQAEPLTIKRGRNGEQGEVAPATWKAKLENASGDLTPGNPMGQWFGKLGRGTPWRFGLTVAEDTFTGRTVSNGWGTATTGEVWSIFTGMGAAGDYAVSSGAGTQSITATNTYRYAYLPVSMRNVEVAATVTVAINNITGASIEPANVLCRHQGASGAYYYARVSVDASEVLTISIHHSLNGQLVTPVAVPGLVDASSSKVLRAKIQAEGQTIRAKVYAPGAEPAGWQVTVHDTAITTAGMVGVRNGVASGNTNTLPIVFSVDDIEIRALRFAGELAEVKPRWNTTHTDEWAEVTASTVLRRLKAGKTPLKSTLRRAYLADDYAFPVQYWPCEEGEDAKQFSSAVDSRNLNIEGRPKFAQFKEFLSSSPLAYMNGSRWTGQVAPYVANGQGQFRFLIAVPRDGHGGGNDVPVAWLVNAYPATLRIWELVYKVNGGMAVNIFNSAGAQVYAGGSIALALNGALVRVSLELTQNGANVDWGLSGFDVVSGAAGGASASIAGTFYIPETVVFGPVLAQPVTDIAVGHSVIQSQITSTAELGTEYDAWRGESPTDRAVRLGGENGFSASWIGSTSRYPMGPQLPTVLYRLLEECQNGAQGTLYDSRMSGNEVVLRALNATYAQDSRLTLDYAAQQISPPFHPDADDLPVRNDITAKRLVGGDFRVSRETGPLNAQDPGADDDAAGRVDEQVTVNVQYETQLPDVAGWELHLGTTVDERWPKLKVNFLAAGLPAATQLQVLDIDLDDRLTVTNVDAAGYPDDVELIARGYTETYNTTYEHGIEFNCAPYSPYNVGVYGQSTSRYGAALTTLTGALTSSGTSWTANVTEPWGTAAGNFPLSVVIGGEVISISGISAASGSIGAWTQVFTVAASGRAVNGVVKAHSAGDEITVAGPVYYGR